MCSSDLVMVEGGGDQIPEDQILAALKHAHSELQPVIEVIEELQSKIGQPKIVPPEAPDTSALEAEIRGKAEARLTEVGRASCRERV